jgi:hypothetical protein
MLSLLQKYNLQHIDLVKIDVEGYEFDVLNGLFEKNILPANIIFEYIPDAFLHAPALITLLNNNGYLIKDIDGGDYSDQTEVLEYNLWAQKI